MSRGVDSSVSYHTQYSRWCSPQTPPGPLCRAWTGSTQSRVIKPERRRGGGETPVASCPWGPEKGKITVASLVYVIFIIVYLLFLVILILIWFIIFIKNKYKFLSWLIFLSVCLFVCLSVLLEFLSTKHF